MRMDEVMAGVGPSLKSKKFIAYMATMPLLVGLLVFQCACNVYLIVEGKESLFSEGYLLIQVYVIAILAVLYVGGQAALDALLGWIRGGGSKAPQVVVNTAAQREERYPVGVVPDDLKMPGESP
jgi:hypothetical protein